MDPSIVKFLEDDEDENLHSGADVEAFSAALTRDIGGDPPPHVHQPSDPDVELNSQGSSPAPQQLLEQWKTSSENENVSQGVLSVSKQSLEQWKTCTEDENPGQGMQQTEEQNSQSLKQHLSHIEQTKQEIVVNENDQVTENQSDSGHHLSQEGHSQSDKQWNPSPTVEKDETKTIEKISIRHHKQESAQSSTSPNHSSQQLNVQQSLPSSEENRPHSLQHLNVQQPQVPSEATNSARQMKQMPSIPFHLLIPILRPHLDKDRSMQLQAIFAKLRSNEVSKEDFLRVIRNIVGDQMLRQAAQKLQVQLQAPANRNPPMNPNMYSLQNQMEQKSLPVQPPNVPHLTIQRQTESSFSTLDNSIQKSREVDNKSDGKSMHLGQSRSAGLNAGNQERENAMTSLQAVNKLPQHTQVPQSSFSMHGNTSNFHPPYPRHSIGAQATVQKSQGQVLQTNKALHSQGITATQLGSSQLMGMTHIPKYEIQNTGNESRRIHGGSLGSHTLLQQSTVAMQAYPNKEQRSTAMPPLSLVKPEVIDQASEPLGRSQLTVPEGSSFGISDIEQNEQLSSRMGFSTSMSTAGNHGLGPTPTNDGTTQISSATPLLISGNATKTPQKKTSAGHKKPLEAPGSSPPSSKKQKTSGAFHDQSIDQLNDVTAVSGVNLREEEEQLLCAPKEESRASEASRRVVQEEEERLILQRGPLHKKLAEITSKCGLKSIGGDVERCLSLCVEERLRGLVSYLIKLSKQRVDSEKTRHRFVVTSDVGRQILSINKKIKDGWDKKQAEEAEKLRKVNDVDIRTGNEAEKDKEKDKEKDEGRLKATKVNKEEDDKMRTTAANVAARAAVGGDDMLSKWQLMAEQARQKREELDGASSSQSTKTLSHNSTPSFKMPELQDSEKHGSPTPLSGIRRKPPRIQSGMANIKVPHTISVKDVISALEREPQMSKSTLLYSLYERKAGDLLHWNSLAHSDAGRLER